MQGLAACQPALQEARTARAGMRTRMGRQDQREVGVRITASQLEVLPPRISCWSGVAASHRSAWHVAAQHHSVAFVIRGVKMPFSEDVIKTGWPGTPNADGNL